MKKQLHCQKCFLFINILLYRVFVTDERRTVKTVINESAITNKLFLSGVSTKYCNELQSNRNTGQKRILLSNLNDTNPKTTKSIVRNMRFIFKKWRLRDIFCKMWIQVLKTNSLYYHSSSITKHIRLQAGFTIFSFHNIVKTIQVIVVICEMTVRVVAFKIS